MLFFISQQNCNLMKKSNLTRFNHWFSTILLLLGLALPMAGFTQVTTQSVNFCVDYTCVAQTPGFAAQQINFQSVTITGFRNLTRMGATNTWCGTFNFPEGEEVRYSFYYAGAAGAGGDESLTGSGTCFSQGAGGLKRTYIAGTGNPPVFAWESCSSTPVCPPPPQPAAPTVAAPAPTCGQANVISVYSDTYTNNIAGTNFNPNWGQSGFGSATTSSLSGNEMRYYPNMNYQGIALGSNQNVSSFQSLRLDIWSANCSSIDIFLVTAANGERAVRRTLTLNSWNSIEIQLADYTAQGIPLTAIKEFKFVTVTPANGANIYVDNIHFVNSSCATAPTTVNTTFCVDFTCVAQTPGFAAQQINFQSTTITGFRNLTRMGATDIWCGTFAFPVGEVVRYSFYYAGASGVVGDESLTGSGTCFSQGAGGLKRTYTTVAGGSAMLTFAWEACSSTPVCPPPPAPTVAPPTPTCAQANVISLFSDAYTNVPVNTWLTPWSQAAGGNVVSIAGNNTRLYNNVNFLGIETTGANLINTTGMANFHIDVWTPNMTTFRVKLVDVGANGNFGGGDDREGEIAFTPTQNGWNSYVIPLASFQAVGLATRAHIAQLILSGIPVGQGTLYVDNIYFSRVNCTDVTPPTVNCSNLTVTFNGESSIPLVASQLATASDNFGTANLSINTSSITCQQVGQSVPVTVTATDATGNTSTCISTVTVAGLPCGWSSNSNSIGCTSNVVYAPGTGTWTNTASSCFYGPPYTADDVAFVQRTLCGDGSITARVTGINPLATGWAGIVMRESNAPGAKKAQLMTNLGSDHRREFRTTTNGASQPQQFQSLSRYWLRINRVGNQFTMLVSSNGINWFPVGAQNIVMNQCIQIGLVTTNYTANSTVTTTFANVSFTGSNPTSGANINEVARSIDTAHGFEVYPNPTSGELNLDLTQYIGSSVRIETYSLEGKLLQFTELDEVQNTLERLDLKGFQNGMYLVKVKAAGLPEVTRRVVKQ
jgi:hypothetical protein